MAQSGSHSRHIHRPSTAPLRIGIVFDRVEDYEDVDGPPDRFAEFEPESTILAMEEAIRISGHTPVRIGSPHRLLDSGPHVDLVWNIGEGYGSRNREAWAPVLCEIKGIPVLGSDAFALTVSLDKVLTKQIARHMGIPTSDWQVVPFSSHASISNSGTQHPSEPLSDFPSGKPSVPEPLLSFPLFLKPRYEGTSKGITEKSVVHSPVEFRNQCHHLLKTYRQDVMVEPFLNGAELTCAMAGHPLKAFPILERGLHSSGIGSHAVDKTDHLQSLTRKSTGSQSTSGSQSAPVRDASKPDSAIHVTGAITPSLEAEITDWSQRLCEALGIHDFVRMDYKLTADGKPMFLEANPLPTFGIDSTFAILAEMEGKPYPEFLSAILRAAIRRLNL